MQKSIPFEWQNAIDDITNDLLSHAKEDSNGIYWETWSPIHFLEKNYSKEVLAGLYNGNAGILLYLMEVFSITQDEKLRTILQKSADWLTHYCAHHSTKDYGFYSGIGGISYVLIKASQLLNDKQYLQAALHSMKEASSLTETGPLNLDLLSGTAGTLLALLHLFNETEDQGVLDQIKILLKQLIDHFHFAKKGGISWGKAYRYIDCLCGLSHGASGISWVLFEVSAYFSNKELEILAKQAYLYEKAYFDHSENNWPDFRKDLFSGEQIKSAVVDFAENEQPWSEPTYMSAWCHGAPGIGMSRLRMYEITGDKVYLDEAHAALENTISNTEYLGNFSLCHGIGGNAYLPVMFLTSGYAKNDNLNTLLEKYVGYAIRQKTQLGHYLSGRVKDFNKQDISLFNGSSGIGYFMLFAAMKEPGQLDILCPGLKDSRSKIKLSFDIELSSSFLSKLFPSTSRLLQQLDNKAYKDLLETIYVFGEHENLKQRIIKKLQSSINTSSYKEILTDLFLYEDVLHKLSQSPKGNVHTYLQELHLYYQHEEIFSHFPNGLQAQIHPESMVHTMKWPWHLIEDEEIDLKQLPDTPGRYTIFLKATTRGCQVQELNDLNTMLLQKFKKSKDIQQVVLTMIKGTKKKEKEEIKALLYSQIQELRKAGILVYIPAITP
nr:lanthionine synthetase LanC family protein [uncultured Chryseobacterium sp.]